MGSSMEMTRMSRNENQVERTRKPPCPRKESVTDGTHDGTAGQGGERREERHRSKQPTAYSLSLSRGVAKTESGVDIERSLEMDVCIRFLSFVAVRKGGRT